MSQNVLCIIINLLALLLCVDRAKFSIENEDHGFFIMWILIGILNIVAIILNFSQI